MIADFTRAAQLGGLLAKDFAADIFKLLVNYDTISASEVASRLGLHIKTCQDFLEGLATLGITAKDEVNEGKRPYFRYSLAERRIGLEIDLAAEFLQPTSAAHLQRQLREKKNVDVRFAQGRDGASISSVTIWTGDGRERQENKINLTQGQGRFLFRLPFPSAEPASIAAIMQAAAVPAALAGEILNLVDWLLAQGVVEEAMELQEK